MKNEDIKLFLAFNLDDCISNYLSFNYFGIKPEHLVTFDIIIQF